jgi:hypothetical protein
MWNSLHHANQSELDLVQTPFAFIAFGEGRNRAPVNQQQFRVYRRLNTSKQSLQMVVVSSEDAGFTQLSYNYGRRTTTYIAVTARGEAPWGWQFYCEPESILQVVASYLADSNATDTDSANTRISSLNIARLSNLTSLDVTFNNISSLDLSTNLKLEQLRCSLNPIAALDLTAPNLQVVFAKSCLLQADYVAFGDTNTYNIVDLSNNPTLGRMPTFDGCTIRKLILANCGLSNDPNQIYVTTVDYGQLFWYLLQNNDLSSAQLDNIINTFYTDRNSFNTATDNSSGTTLKGNRLNIGGSNAPVTSAQEAKLQAIAAKNCIVTYTNPAGVQTTL